MLLIANTVSSFVKREGGIRIAEAICPFLPGTTGKQEIEGKNPSTCVIVFSPIFTSPFTKGNFLMQWLSVGHDPFGVEQPSHRGPVSGLLHIRCLRYNS